MDYKIFVRLLGVVSFETAKELKNSECEDLSAGGYYKSDGCVEVLLDGKPKEEDGTFYKMVSLYDAQKWLREDKGIHIAVEVHNGEYYATLWDVNGTFIKTLANKGPSDEGNWYNYEEALDAGILEALNTKLP